MTGLDHEPLRIGRTEPRDASLRGLAEELAEQRALVVATWHRPVSRHVHWTTAQAALLRHGWWGDRDTVNRLRAHIADVQKEMTQGRIIEAGTDQDAGRIAAG